jgi:hypothetical protein
MYLDSPALHEGWIPRGCLLYPIEELLQQQPRRQINITLTNRSTSCKNLAKNTTNIFGPIPVSILTKIVLPITSFSTKPKKQNKIFLNFHFSFLRKFLKTDKKKFSIYSIHRSVTRKMHAPYRKKSSKRSKCTNYRVGNLKK